MKDRVVKAHTLSARNAFQWKNYLDGPIHVGLFDAQHNLPGDSDAIEEVVDETHIVYEGVNVTGAQHQQSGDQLDVVRGREVEVILFFLHMGQEHRVDVRVFSCRRGRDSR